MIPKGSFITFEGIDGSGKSTQARKLAEHLQAQGRDVVLTREPGGSEGAEEIRALVLQGEPDRWSAETEILLFPAIEAGKVVICDRFADSTRMYQGLSRGDLRGTVDQLHKLMIGREPDMTILIDMDSDTGLSRALSRQGVEERFETFGADLQAQMRAGFLSLAEEFKERFVVINGARSIDEVSVDVCQTVDEHLTTQ